MTDLSKFLLAFAILWIDVLAPWRCSFHTAFKRRCHFCLAFRPSSQSMCERGVTPVQRVDSSERLAMWAALVPLVA